MKLPLLNDITGAAVYPMPILVIVIAVKAPAATAAVAVAPVPVPFIKTVGAVVQPVPPVFTAIELMVDVAAAKVVAIVPQFIFEAFEIKTLGAAVNSTVPLLINETLLIPPPVVVVAYLS